MTYVESTRRRDADNGVCTLGGVPIHPTHNLAFTPIGSYECTECWACTCHQAGTLVEACTDA